MRTSFNLSFFRLAIIFYLFVSIFCGLGWIWQARKLREADDKLASATEQIRALEMKNREFDDRQRPLVADISAIKERFDAVQIALLEIDERFMDRSFRANGEERTDAPEIETAEPESSVSLPITIGATGDGQVSSLQVGVSKLFDGPFDQSRLKSLDRRLSDVFNIDGKPYDRFLLRIGGSLRFDELLKILVVCSRQGTADGMVVNRIGFLRICTD